MKKSLWLLSLHLVFFNSFSQIQEKSNLKYKNGSYNVFIVKVDSSFTKNLALIENNHRNTEKFLFDSLEINGKFFAVNAGIVDSSCTLLGLFINNSRKITDINRQNGSGNFYLKPNGFFAVTETGNAEIKSSDNYNPGDSYSMAIQSGPMLINNSIINSQFSKNSKNLNFRLGVGVYSENSKNYVVFALSQNKVTFYDFALLFLERFKCKNALNIEGGDNCSMHLPNSNSSYSSKKAPCKYYYLQL